MRKKVLIISAVLLSIVLVFTGCAKKTANAQGQILQVKELGSFFVGGSNVTVNVPEDKMQKDAKGNLLNFNGDYESGQMYVSYVKLEEPKAKYPLLLWHGSALTGATFETTPDGRPGWQTFFLKQGHDVYVSDAVERGRAGFSMFPEVYTDAPQYRSKQAGWGLFRFGPEYGVAFEGLQFPVESYDYFNKQFVPRWKSTDPLALEAYVEYMNQFDDGAVVIAHSQGTKFAMDAMLEAPEKFKGVVLLEPFITPDLEKTDFSKIKGVPVLIIYGDFIKDSPFWASAYDTIKKYAEAVEKAGGSVTWIDLPEKGINGNSHQLYMDKNSDEVAKVVQDWFHANNLMAK